METKLDYLYYRTPAQPSACGPYKTTSTYNGCSFAEAHQTVAPSRTDYTYKTADAGGKGGSSMSSASDAELISEITTYPKSFTDILGKDEAKQIAFITKHPQLVSILQPYFPNLIAKLSLPTPVPEGFKILAATSPSPKIEKPSIVAPPAQVSDIVKAKQLKANPELLSFILGKDLASQVKFVKTNMNDKDLMKTISKSYPSLFAKALNKEKFTMPNHGIGIF